MGSREDILKNLGIPEYPWSSDDDELPADPRPPPSTQARTSGPQATTSSTPATGTAARCVQTRQLFLSLLNQTDNNAYNTRSSTNRTEELPLAYLPRTTHTPAAELRGGGGGGASRADLDIQRVLAFKRLTRNINNGRCAGRYNVQRGTSSPNSVVPLENVSGSVRLPYYRRVNRNSATNNIPGSARQIVVDHGHQQSRASERRRHRSHSLEVLNSDDEPDESSPPTASRAASTASTAMVTDEPSVEPEPEVEVEVPLNVTDGGVSLDEVIVIEPTTVDMGLIDRARAVIPSSSDPNLASTSRCDEVDSPEMEQHNHGVKRKRRESADEKPAEPFTVKDFNQSLLRLLECPVCLEWMEPPMSQCRRGHLVCSRCRARLASCPVCRTTFSSVRNRAMEGVAEMLRYPCRHGCGREVRLRRRTPHEASCAARKYLCPAPLCADRLPLPRSQLAAHFHAKHMHLLKLGTRHHFGIKVNNEAHDNWLIIALDEFFHIKVDVDIRTWGVIVYVAYIGPKCNAMDFAYEVIIEGQHNSRNLRYKRATHSDLESSSLNVSRQDCFHLTLDQALNFIRFKNRHCDAEKFLEFDVEISKIDPPPSRDDSDS